MVAAPVSSVSSEAAVVVLVFALVVGLDQPLDEVALLQAVAKVDAAFRQNSLEFGHRQGRQAVRGFGVGVGGSATVSGSTVEPAPIVAITTANAVKSTGTVLRFSRYWCSYRCT